MTTDIAKEPVLTKVPRGHWRNLFKFIPGKANWIGNQWKTFEWIDEYHFYGTKKWPCKDSAETAAIRVISGMNDYKTGRRKYLGPKFFPGA